MAQQLHYELLLALQDHRNGQLQEENQLLVRVALSAQALQAAAEQANRQQARLASILSTELRALGG